MNLFTATLSYSFYNKECKDDLIIIIVIIFYGGHNYQSLIEYDLNYFNNITNIIIYKNGDDIAVSISRSFERLEERIDAVESRLYSRLSELEDVVEGSRQNVSDTLGDIRTEIREISFSNDDKE